MTDEEKKDLESMLVSRETVVRSIISTITYDLIVPFASRGYESKSMIFHRFESTLRDIIRKAEYVRKLSADIEAIRTRDTNP